ncbi:MAG: hypothetical protein GKR87_07960 [Kiritimatiellae bacterium]|nr:hypothetical protein [Kiritimatiellia bacterium]
MKSWSIEIFKEVFEVTHHIYQTLYIKLGRGSAEHRVFRFGILIAVVILCIVLLNLLFIQPQFIRPLIKTSPVTPPIDYTQPVRDEPSRFPPKTHRPNIREGKASVSIKDYAFDPKQHLTQIYDDRVWWESEHDKNDTEDDHVIHRAMEEPMKRLIELVDLAGGQLKVQDAYRDKGIHSRASLHKQGRALDITAKNMSLEKLAKLSWAAGFDWVYYESPKKGGAHVHASVRPIITSTVP